MSPELEMVFFFLLAFLLLVLITWLLYTFLKWDSENSRKFLHVSGGILCLLIPGYIQSHWSVLFLCVCALSLLAYTFFTRQLPAIHRTKRVSYGSILFPLPVYGCFLVMSSTGILLYYYLPILLLTIADTSAEMAGKKWGHLSLSFFKGQKTLIGSMAFLVMGMISALLHYFIGEHPPSYTLAVLLGIVLSAMVTELVSLKGFDNVTVPAVVLLLLYLVI